MPLLINVNPSLVAIFNVGNRSLNAVREDKILVKIPNLTVRVKRRFKLAWTSFQSYQSLLMLSWLLGTQAFFMQTSKTLVRMS